MGTSRSMPTAILKWLMRSTAAARAASNCELVAGEGVGPIVGAVANDGPFVEGAGTLVGRGGLRGPVSRPPSTLLCCCINAVRSDTLAPGRTVPSIPGSSRPVKRTLTIKNANTFTILNDRFKY